MYKTNKDIMKNHQLWQHLRKIIKQIEYKKGVNFIMEKLTNEQVKKILDSCQGKSKEEIQEILRTKEGKMLVQETAETLFPKEKK